MSEKQEMNDDNDFYTETMAKVYADQGYLEKAVDIYKYLLEREPGRQDLSETIFEIEKKIDAKMNTGKEHLVPLFSQWIDFVLKYNKIKQLEKVSKSVSGLPKHLSDE